MAIITFLAVVGIVIVFLFYLRPLLRLKNFTKIIEGAKDLSDLSSHTTILSILCTDYKNTLSVDKNGEKKTLYHAEEFFNNSELSRAWGVNLRHINSAPGVLSGLGVLGTFIGLTFSVATFDSTDSTAIMSSIKTLLGGMGTAFITSLIGMALSAFYIIFQKRLYNNYDNAIAAFVRLCDEKLRFCTTH